MLIRITRKSSFATDGIKVVTTGERKIFIFKHADRLGLKIEFSLFLKNPGGFFISKKKMPSPSLVKGANTFLVDEMGNERETF